MDKHTETYNKTKGGLDKPRNVTIQIDVSFVYFRFFLLFCVVIFAKDIGFKSVLYFVLSFPCPEWKSTSYTRFKSHSSNPLNPQNADITSVSFFIVYFEPLLITGLSSHFFSLYLSLPPFFFVSCHLSSIFLYIIFIRYLCCESLYCFYVTVMLGKGRQQCVWCNILVLCDKQKVANSLLRVRSIKRPLLAV